VCVRVLFGIIFLLYETDSDCYHTIFTFDLKWSKWEKKKH